jgi:SAM-dependent methyltransferase
MTHTIKAGRIGGIAAAAGSLSDNVPAPWEVFRPQQAVVELVWDGRIRGDVLDAGCGTGENALFLAEHGLRVTGIDISEGLVRRARQKATRRGTDVEFAVGDVLASPLPGRRFDSVIDSGLFHTLHPSDRFHYAAKLLEATREGGVLFMLCFSDSAPGYVGPACLSRADIERVFGQGWRLEDLEESRFELRQGFVPGWLACIRRTAPV